MFGGVFFYLLLNYFNSFKPLLCNKFKYSNKHKVEEILLLLMHFYLID